MAAPIQAASSAMRGAAALLLLPRLHRAVTRLRRQIPRAFVRIRAAVARAGKQSTGSGGESGAAQFRGVAEPAAWLQELRATSDDVARLGLAALPTEGGAQAQAGAAVAGAVARVLAEALCLGPAAVADAAGGGGSAAGGGKGGAR